MAVDSFVETLSSLGAHRARDLHREGILNRLFVYLGPDNSAAQANRQEWQHFHSIYPGPMWGWWVCRPAWQLDVNEIREKTSRYPGIGGWMLNIEAPLQHVPLGGLLAGAAANDLPMIASLAGVGPAYTTYDYRALDLYNVPVDWQCYLDTGEGPAPATAVNDLLRVPFVVEGEEYRHAWRGRYGWGMVMGVQPTSYRDHDAAFNSYRVPRTRDATFQVTAREWGWTVTDRRLTIANGSVVGEILGRAAYNRSRVTLDTTRSAAERRSLDEWTTLAASARVPNARRRPVSVYLAETTPDAVFRAIAAGAAP